MFWPPLSFFLMVMFAGCLFRRLSYIHSERCFLRDLLLTLRCNAHAESFQFVFASKSTTRSDEDRSSDRGRVRT